MEGHIVDSGGVIIRKWGWWSILMTFHDAASLHLNHIVTVDVVVLDELLYVNEVGCSFCRYCNLSVIPDLTVHLSLKVDYILLSEAAVHDLAFIVSFHEVVYYVLSVGLVHTKGVVFPTEPISTMAPCPISRGVHELIFLLKAATQIIYFSK